jgi:8-oxo-dGTP pyrophosphatase MutT (NUDIX family)
MAKVKHRIIARSLQSYWRLSRGLTMGAQGLVIDEAGRVLLVRHTYRPGWHFPGGGVERNETARTALVRELLEESGVIVETEPELFALYANFQAFPSDHIALFVIRTWRRPVVPKPNREIAAADFFERNALPPNTVGAVSRRLGEVLDRAKLDENW